MGGISGAFSFAGMTLRLATIKALTVCKIVEINIGGILTLLDQYPDACQTFREIAEKRFKELAPEPLEEHPFFKGFSKSFLNTLRTKCNSQVFFTGETIIKQGDAADSMIIISPASVVTIFVDGRKLKDLSGGCTLGVRVDKKFNGVPNIGVSRDLGVSRMADQNGWYLQMDNLYAEQSLSRNSRSAIDSFTKAWETLRHNCGTKCLCCSATW